MINLSPHDKTLGLISQVWGIGIRKDGGERKREGESAREGEREKERERKGEREEWEGKKFIMHNKTKGVVGNITDIKIRGRQIYMKNADLKM